MQPLNLHARIIVAAVTTPVADSPLDNNVLRLVLAIADRVVQAAVQAAVDRLRVVVVVLPRQGDRPQVDRGWFLVGCPNDE